MACTGRAEGGYCLISVSLICAAWIAYRQKHIEFRDLRVWFAAHEMASRRCRMGQGRKAKHTLAELKGLVGGIGGGHLRTSLRRLNQQGLVRWSECSIAFPDANYTPFLEGMIQRIVNHRRKLPVPRRSLRFIAKCSRPTLVATMLGYLLRCVYARNRSLRADGCCAASWISATFGVDLRNVRRSKVTLECLGWLSATSSPHWHRQRWGGKACVNLAWSPSSGSNLPRRIRQTTTDLPPPLNKELSSKEILNPEPANRTVGASIKRIGKESLTRVTVPDLHEPQRVDALWRQAAAAGWVTLTQADRLNVHAAAERAKRIGRRNPSGLFIALVRGRLWSVIAQEDEDRARGLLRTLDESSMRPHRAELTPHQKRLLAPPDMEPVRELLLRSLASVSHLHGDDFPHRQTAPVRPMAGGSLSGANRGQGGTVGEEALRTRGVAP